MTYGMLTWKSNLPRNDVPVYSCVHGLQYTVDSSRAHMNAIHGSWLTWRRFDVPGTYFRPLTADGPLLDLANRRGEPAPVEVPAGTLGEEDLGGLTPAELLAFWVQCSRDGRDELLALVAEEGRPAGSYASVSPHYVICGDKAYGSVLSVAHAQPHWVNLRLERHEGRWRVPVLAAQ